MEILLPNFPPTRPEVPYYSKYHSVFSTEGVAMTYPPFCENIPLGQQLENNKPDDDSELYDTQSKILKPNADFASHPNTITTCDTACSLSVHREITHSSQNVVKKVSTQDGTRNAGNTRCMADGLPHVCVASSLVSAASTSRDEIAHDSREVIVCVGGITRTQLLADVNCFDPVALTWSPLTPLPHAVRYPGAVSLDDGSIFVCGGLTSPGEYGRVLPTVLRRDPMTGQWNNAAPMQHARERAGAAVLHSRIYVAGGQGWRGRLTDAVEMYDPQCDQWRSVARLPTPMNAFAMVAHQDYLYTFGGRSPERYLDSVFRYDPHVDTWSELAGMRMKHGSLSACVGSSGLIFVVNFGQNVAGSIKNPMEAYDTRANRWQTKARTNQKRICQPGTCLVGETIYAVGADEEVGQPTGRSMECYNEIADRWTMHGSQLPTGASGVRCVVIKSSIITP
ncbi:kelch-like protein 12 [Paramacrobiotus metropolitanus]|uniref:kelch-like protein 12 n=1 Tax=Paramacrobiotus metropolitanus TaxID=2943436 RepID=UPI002446353C|nr:kelch-like protein 12 [Paramacrobiotus metropolitanus]